MERGGIAHVFDASALIAFLKDEPGAEATEAFLTDASASKLVHAVNLCEVAYHFMKLNRDAAVAAELDALETAGLETRPDMDPHFWRSVARLKATIQHASLGDSFAIGLAERFGATIVTADRPSFQRAAEAGICRVVFVR